MPVQTWRQLAALIEGRILDGTYPPGFRLPTIAEITADGEWSKANAERAYRDLNERGFVVSRHRWGTVVRNRSLVRIPLSRYGKVLQPSSARGPWETATAEQGLDGRMVATGVEVIEAPEDVRAALGLPEGSQAVRRSRRATIGDDTVQIQHAWYSESFATEAGLAGRAKVEGGAYGAMAAAGVPPSEADEVVRARMPTTEEAAQLSIGTLVPVLVVERITRDSTGRALELLQIIGAADRLELVYDHLPISEHRS